MPKTRQNKDVTIDTITNPKFGFGPEICQAMLDNEPMAEAILEAYTEANTHNNGIAAGKLVFDTPDVDETTGDELPNGDTTGETGDTVTVDLDAELTEATARLTSFDKMITDNADNTLMVESLTASRVLASQAVENLSGQVAESKNKALLDNIKAGISEAVTKFRADYRAQTGQNLRNFIVNYVYDGIEIAPNCESWVVQGGKGPAKAKAARSTGADPTRQAERDKKAAEKAEAAKVKEAAKAKNAEHERAAHNISAFGCTVKSGDGSSADFTLAQLVDRYATDEIKALKHWTSKGTGWRYSPKGDIPKKVLAQVEAQGLTVTAKTS